MPDTMEQEIIIRKIEQSLHPSLPPRCSVGKPMLKYGCPIRLFDFPKSKV